MNAVVYLHGKGGSAAEAAHYQPLFPDCTVLGADYRADTPWDAKTELAAYFEKLSEQYGHITLIANSIGAYFAMCAGADRWVRRAFFISPIVDMEALIGKMLAWSSHTEAELQACGEIATDFGETLSWQYLSYVRENPISWRVPTEILYGEKDGFTDYATMAAFAKAHGAGLAVMPDGEHWFHTPEQMRFLDDWILRIMSTNVIYRDERFLLEVRDGAPYLTADGCKYALSCHPYEPCTYVKGEAGGTIAVRNAFEVSSAMALFARGETIHAITGKDYDAKAFCELLAYAAALGADADIGYVEGALAVEKLIALGATAPETAVRVQTVGVGRISDAFSHSKKLRKRVLYTDDGRAYVRIKQ